VGAGRADGVLTVTVPKSHTAKPRPIEVRESSGQNNGQRSGHQGSSGGQR
jgi:hypothetical protein